jgi:hypothetical protein
MPTMKSLEASLRALGWVPAEVQTSDVVRVWVHPVHTDAEIRVLRTPEVTRAYVARILRKAARAPHR